MKKRTRSILDELRNIGRVQDTEALIETTGSNIIESAVNTTCKQLRKTIPLKWHRNLKDVLLISIKNGDPKKV